MSSEVICSIMEASIHKVYPAAEVIKIPVADGGEGSVDAFLAAVGGEKVSVRITGPLFQELDAFYGRIDGGRTAVIEMAACAGLPLVGDKKDPRYTTTYGVGQLLSHAVENGCQKIILGLGGSATNDAGAGAASALGVRFINRDGQSFIPVGATLKDIVDIDLSMVSPKMKQVEFVIMCDIDNPLYGETGAAFVFAPQKGATPEVVAQLDEGLKHFATILQTKLGEDVATLPGAGAAGGMGAGMAAFFHPKMQMGIETVLDTVHFDQLLEHADLVFTGEGRIDAQTLHGKVVSGITKRTKPYQIPVIAIVGDIGDDVEPLYEEGISIFSINRVAVDYKTARTRAKSDLFKTMENVMRFIRAIENRRGDRDV